MLIAPTQITPGEVAAPPDAAGVRDALGAAAITTAPRAAASSIALATAGRAGSIYPPRAITLAPAETATSIALAWSAAETAAFVGATRTGMTVASGAMPTAPPAAAERAARMPAMAVPEPRQSVLPRPVPPIMSPPTVTRPASSGTLASTPESTIATITPAPRL